MQTDVDTVTEVEQSQEAGLAAFLFGDSCFQKSLTPGQIQQLSPSALAYLGDAVYELFVRCSFLIPPKRINTYHQQVVSQVRAETQASHLQVLIPYLTSSEKDLLKRGRNSVTGRPKRIDPETYQQATSLETLVGYLYLTDPHRLIDLFSQLDLDPTSKS